MVKLNVEQIRKLIKQIAQERDVKESLVEKALKDAIVTAIKKGKNIKGNLIVEFTDEGIKPYLVELKEIFEEKKKQRGKFLISINTNSWRERFFTKRTEV